MPVSLSMSRMVKVRNIQRLPLRQRLAGLVQAFAAVMVTLARVLLHTWGHSTFVIMQASKQSLHASHFYGTLCPIYRHNLEIAKGQALQMPFG